MRILISDYSGHPFQVQLSRALAMRGHDVLHVSAESFQTPKGRLTREAGDPAGFSIVGVRSDEPFAKDSFVKRRRQEIELGAKIAAEIERFRPQIVLSSNAPLDAQRLIQRAARTVDARFIFWVQDVYSEAIARILRQKFGPAGALIGAFYRWLEARMLRRSDHVVVIADAFVPIVRTMAGLAPERVTVIENWAPLAEVPRYPRDNAWAEANLPPSRFRAIYSGTLGFKHNPSLLFDLARNIDGDVLVFSEGSAANALAAQARDQGVTNLTVSGWLPFNDLPKALAAADLLLVILEPDAGVFSVPSKVLTYLCVGRPILGAIPAENLAAHLIEGNGAGRVVDPTNSAGFTEAARAILADAPARATMGDAARGYAERTFDIATIADRFETVFHQLA
jgi:colanic acid biosynthesis glycosyl transferase WcaI